MMTTMPECPNCPKCSSQMDEGFILDKTHGSNEISKWVEGPPKEISFWFGVETPKDKMHQVTTFRCSKCGYLESYALA